MSIDKLLIRSHKEDDRDIISQCCICKDFVSTDETYITLTDEEIKQVYSKYLVSHGYCEPCLVEYIRDFN